MIDRRHVESLFDLDGRVAIVTGGSRGIGRGIAEILAAFGAKVVVASRKADACESTVQEITATGGTAVAVPAHVGRLDDIERLAATAVERFGGVDILVNNAANALAQPMGRITAEAWQKSQDTNLRGPLFLFQAVLPQLRASEHAAVINLLSAGIYTRGVFTSMYLSAKAGLALLTRAMAAEFAADGIRVNALVPGTTDTDMVRNNPPERQQWMIDSALMRRIGTVEELAVGALYLASDASSFMTGQSLVIDGGMTVH
ncbi:MAG: glucose 1-dehydrogenase [Acidimicrobiia bacterium]